MIGIQFSKEQLGNFLYDMAFEENSSYSKKGCALLIFVLTIVAFSLQNVTPLLHVENLWFHKWTTGFQFE